LLYSAALEWDISYISKEERDEGKYGGRNKGEH